MAPPVLLGIEVIDFCFDSKTSHVPQCTLRKPAQARAPMVVVATQGGAVVAVTREQGPRWSFQTKAGESYTVSVQSFDGTGAVRL